MKFNRLPQLWKWRFMKLSRPSNPLSHQRIAGLQCWMAAEIPVGSPQLGHAMGQTQGRDPRVVNLRPGNLAVERQVFQLMPMVACFGQENQPW